jgi:hypothetical protein
MKNLTLVLLLLAGCAASSDHEAPRPKPGVFPDATLRAASQVGTFTVLVTAGGKPLAGALVIFRGGAEVPTDSAGRAQVASDWDYATVRVRAPGMAQGEGLVGRDAAETVVALSPEASIVGHLRTTGGEPVANAAVWVTVSPAGPKAIKKWARADATGAFEVKDLAEGDSYHLYAQAEGFALSSATTTAPQKDLRLVLSRPGRLAITVKVARPDVYGYEVTLERLRGERPELVTRHQVAKTPPFVHEYSLEPGRYRFTVTGETIGTATLESITVPEGGATSVTVEPETKRLR